MADKETRAYRGGEIADLNRAIAERIQVKIVTHNDTESHYTKWLTITDSELEAIIKVLLNRED